MLVFIKAFKALILPPGINLVVALAGFIVLPIKRRLGIVLLFLSLFSLYLFSITPVTNLLLSGLETHPALPDRVVDQGEKAIVVLAGGRYSHAPEYAGDTVNAWTLERLRYAVMLKKKTGLPLLVSGGKFDEDDAAEAVLMASVVEEAFGEDVQWLEIASRNTAENARFSAELLRHAGIDKIYLVTHAVHMSRAVLVFENAGMQVTPAPTVYGISEPDFSFFQKLIPTSSSLSWSVIALHEYLGILWYRMRY